MAVQSWNRVEIDHRALRHNYQVLSAKIGGNTGIMAIVKSEAYGHGLLEVARSLQDEGAQFFGVAELEEGVALRESGIEGDIVVLLGLPGDGYGDAVRYDLSPVVYNIEGLVDLSACAEQQRKKVGVHLKVDVGMGRLGIMPEEMGPMVREISRLPGIRLSGILSHFPLADEMPREKTEHHCARFEKIVRDVQALEPGQKVSHIANSAGLIRYPSTHFDLVRPGIALYGCYPADDEATRSALDLRPVMSFKTSAIQIKEVPAGYGISYGHTYITTRRTKLAVLPVGYDDGYLRRLSNRGEVLIRGRRAPVVGRVCMNACLADVTDLPDIMPGDEVVLLGRQEDGEIAADEIAGWMETIHYEVLCLFGSRNRRIHKK